MLKDKPALLLALLIGLSLNLFAQNTSPVAAVRSFYVFDRAHSQTFDRKAIDERRKWLSESLYKLFLNELKREKEYLRKNPTDKPYFGDGLPFQPIDETCTSGKRVYHKAISIKPDARDGSFATVNAIFAFPPPCTEPDKTVYNIALIKRGKMWLIDNVIYEGARDLVSDLKRKDY